MRSLNFAPWMYHWCKVGGTAVSDLATQSLTPYVLNISVLTFHHSAGFFSPTLQIIRSRLVLLLSGKAVVLPGRIIF